MHEKRKHYRVAMKEIHADPQKGIYITEEEWIKCGILAGFFFLILAVLALLPRKD